MSTGVMVMKRSMVRVARFWAGKPPHFLQLHQGGYDAQALKEFVSQGPEIESWLREDMLGFGGAATSWQRSETVNPTISPVA